MKRVISTLLAAAWLLPSAVGAELAGLGAINFPTSATGRRRSAFCAG